MTDKLEVDFVFSTIPITNLIKCINPQAPENILNVLEDIKYRSMILYYFILEVDQFSPFDAHYFPGSEEIFSRMSEPKNYYNSSEPKGMTGLCLEIPCSTEDKIWQASDHEIGDTVIQQLENANLPINAKIKDRFSRRLENVYPIYNIGYERYLREALKYLLGVDKIISLGRQGLSAHNNTHHSLEMAYRACECLDPDFSWSSELWQFYCEQFDNHVVED